MTRSSHSASATAAADLRIEEFLATIQERAALRPREHQAAAIRAARDQMTPTKPICIQIATGGGKTLVACRLALDALERRQVVYFVAPAWVLLQQAAEGMLAARTDSDGRTRDDVCNSLCRLGGNVADLALPELSGPGNGAVIFTTVQTLRARVEDRARLPKPALVLVDEAHFGERAETGKAVYHWARTAKACVIQFTATPRKDARGSVVNQGGSFPELEAARVLATPVLEDQRPELGWTAKKSRSTGDVDMKSLTELAKDANYRRHIVTAITANNWDKSILFACNVDHARALRDALVSRGVTALLIHSGLGRDEVRDQLELFRKADYRNKTVLINVAMATQGLDVPDVRSVLLARPTYSETLFLQMIGRGSRQHADSGKTTFRIVDFTPNTHNHGDLLCTAQTYFGDETKETQPDARAVRPRPRAQDYKYSLNGTPTWMPGDARPELRGLFYLQGQSFGIEFEITRTNGAPSSPDAEWKKVANAILEAARDAVGEHRVARKPITNYEGIGGSKDTSVWNVEWDATVGWELTTPILMDHRGYDEVARVLERVRAYVERRGSGLTVERAETSTHVHFGWGGVNFERTLRLVRLARLFEPALATLVAPSRVVYFDSQRGDYDTLQPNPYNVPLCARFTNASLRSARTVDDLVAAMQLRPHERAQRDERVRRYTALNLYGFLKHGETLEVRMHSGTLDASKILLWVSLWQQLIWAAEHTRAWIPNALDRDVLMPDGDIVELANAWLLPARNVGPVQERFVARLAARRAEVAQRWLDAAALRPAHRDMRRWL